MLVCDKCSAGITEGSRFCPQCGDPVTEADKVSSPAHSSQIASVEISFGESSSSNFTKAVEICKNIPTYEVVGEDKNIQHKVRLPITEVELLITLYDLVGSWKSSQMLINGHTATKKNLTYHGVGCYMSRQKAFKREQYCFGEKDYEVNIWGCKKLNMPIYEWGGGWLEFGNFDKSGVWFFDKKKIRHSLELAIKENELCPVLNKQRVIETLERLPDSINPKIDKNWEYITSYEEVDGDYKEVATGIKPVIKKLNRYVMGEYSPEWETAEANSERKNDKNVIKIELDTGSANARESKQNSKSAGCSTILWIVAGIVLLLWFLLK